MKTSFSDALKQSLSSGTRTLFFDGAMGSMLQARGLAAGQQPDLWSVDRPETVRSIHRGYLAAGCTIIKSNTFGANRFKLKDCGYPVEQVVNAGISLAAEVCADEAFAALDIGSLGKLLQPLGELSFDDAYDAFAQIINAGKDKADLILIETMTDTYEIKAAVLAAKENCSLPVVVTIALDENEKLLTGGDIDCVVAMLEGLGVDALGLNCGLGPKQMKHIVPKLAAVCSIPIICNPNADLPRVENGRTVYDVTPQQFAEEMVDVAQDAVILGGCCGTTPEHLAAMIKAVRDIPVRVPELKHLTVVSSYNHAVCLSDKPVIIGERINPTGKAKLKAALRSLDMNYLAGEAIAQEDSGAHILDVNVGLPELDEPAVMTQAVQTVQRVSALPLQIDTSNFAAMERAMRIYNGKPLINSVSGKEESMNSVFPLIKKYGGVAVALCLDDNGIPDSVDGRLAVAHRIIERAAEYGIDRSQLVFDALTIAVSTGSDNARITLETTRRLRTELKVATTLGVSNVSFGLPAREHINSTFFSLALQSGLTAAIINPLSDAMMNVYHSFCALNGFDENFACYIDRFSGEAAKPAAAGQLTLKDAIIKGVSGSCAQAVEQLLLTVSPLDIIANEIVPALDEVGRGFESKRIFLPQLLMSADAAKAAFSVINDALRKSGAVERTKGTVLMATVKGDIHDIGKNIVVVLLENYGFSVVDMGKDVEPQAIVDAVVEQDIRLVGLSALMTTTVAGMEETIRLLHQQAPSCRVMVGGAVLNEEYARMIDADLYGKDAMTAVRYAQKLHEDGLL